MQYIKADTSTKVVIGPVVAVGDGFTPVTTLSLSTADEAEILKHDAAAVTDISAATFAAITSADGYYNLTITASLSDTEGRLTVVINDDSLCLPVRQDFMVVNANVFDSFFAAATTDYLQVDTIQVGGATEDIATETKQDVIDTNVDAILVDTAEIGTAGAGLTNLGGMSSTMKAQVNAEADTALTDYDPPTNAEFEARTPTAAQLAYIVRNAQLAKPVTFTSGTLTTAVLNQVDSASPSSVDDYYNGRKLIFNLGTLDMQITDITDYAGGTTTVTFSGLTTPVTSSHTAVLI